ncbi:hypothetical protein D3C72_1570210 [compost metagenome]
MLERGHGAHRHVDLAGQQVGHHGPFAAVGHMQHVSLVLPGDVGLDRMRLRARAPRPHAQLARRCLGIGQQFGNGLGRHAAVDRQHGARGGDVGDRAQLSARIVGQLLVQRQVGRDRAGNGHQQRIAVRRRLGDVVGADDAAGTALVLHHHRLAELARQAIADGARQRVGQPARRVGDDQVDGLGRVGALCAGRGGRGGQGQHGEQGQGGLQQRAAQQVGSGRHDGVVSLGWMVRVALRRRGSLTPA